MKSYIKALAFAVLVTNLYSCAKETSVQQETENTDLTIMATFLPVTKAAMNPERTVEWELRDQISLLYNGHNFALTGKCAGPEAEFTGTVAQLPAGKQYLAIYPYNEAYKLDDRSFLISLPKTPELIEGSFSQAIGTGLVSGNQVVLQHATAYMRFEITRDDITEIIISSKGKQLSGTFKATVSNNGTAGLSAVSGQTFNEIIIDKCIKGQYLIPVPADRYNKLTILFRSAVGTYESSIEKPYNITAGQMADLGAIDAELKWNEFEQPEVTILSKTSSTVSVCWSVSNFSSPAVDLLHELSVGIYRDAACSDPVVSWDIPSSIFISPEATIYGIEGPHNPRFIFTGLDADTEYYVKVWKTDSPEHVSEAISIKTTASKNVLMPSGNAKGGDVILSEDFSELVWGGDVIERCSGYTDQNRHSTTRLHQAAGVNPVGNNIIDGLSHNFVLVDPTNCVGLFNNLRNALGTTRLAEWWSIAEDGTAGKVLACPGYVKLGASDKAGGIVTPVLSAINGSAKVKVSFRAAPYRGTSTDKTKLHVMAITSDKTAPAIGTITEYTKGAKHEFTLSDKNEWVEFSCTLEVKETERIAIYSQRNGAESGQCRVHIDDIRIEVL